nr:MAG TPA_asm: Protein of unknown function (DUF3102) [Caudoviricetes sp.]
MMDFPNHISPMISQNRRFYNERNPDRAGQSPGRHHPAGHPAGHRSHAGLRLHAEGAAPHPGGAGVRPPRQGAEPHLPRAEHLRHHPVLRLEEQQPRAHEQRPAGRDARPAQGNGGAGMIISQNSNDVYYAYTRGRFWRWDGSARVWKESHLLAQKFDKAKAAEKHLTPEAFLTGDEFIPMDDYELPQSMLTALRDAKPCKNAPIDPVEEDSSSGVPAPCICSTCTCGGCKEECFGNCHSCGHPVQECNSYQTEGEKHLTPAHSADVDKPEVPGTQTTQNKPLTTIPDEIRPAFDYSGLDEQTVDDLHFAEKEYQHGKKLAERGLVHMGNAIAAAHDALCGVVQQLDNSKHGNRGDDSFRAWCCSIGITKSTAYNLLQVSALMDGSSPRQRAILEALPPTLLYAVAKPSAPAELVAQVKSGDITTHKQYQEALAQIKAEKERADAAEAERDKLLGAQNRAAWAESHIQNVEAQRDAALADVQGLTEQNAKLQQSYHDADESRIAANLQRQKAEAERDRAEARAKDAENQLAGSRQVAEAAKLRADKLQAENDALKKQPITAVVDKEEVERQAREMAAEMTADLRAQLEQTASGSEQDAHSSYDNVLLADRSFQNIGKMVIPSLRKLPQEQREAVANQLIRTLGQIQGEVSQCL